MTVRLFDEDAYLSEFESKVESVKEVNGRYEVILFKTAFFPTQGGQNHDEGTIDGIEVLDVTIKDDIITHVLKEKVSVGSLVKGKVDFKHRFRNMQMHSGEHIFSGLAHKLYNAENVGFHLSDNSATIDLNLKLSESDLKKLEALVNEAIIKNIDIVATIYKNGEEKDIEYRSKKELSGDIRLVEVKDIDICACCAPHVKSTGEIQLFKITSFDNYKEGVRINYLCGLRAIKNYDASLESLKGISKALSVKQGEEYKGVEKLLSDDRLLKDKNTFLLKKLVENEIEKADFSKENVFILLPDFLKDFLRYAMDLAKEKSTGRIGVFCEDESHMARFLIESDSEDLRELNNVLKGKYGAKGGGKPHSIQGTVETCMRLKELF
ncbi:MAG: alanyl-tRNA editing protein [Lachnospiraceae bacterium]|nr:alanyl-tRNA editing protein [Lachnospiraceae bacterium]